ncbi:MFS transporter [bacterium SCSIO 12696]|nr:MFS transporter [bacterium SCSIO 12696]
MQANAPTVSSSRFPKVAPNGAVARLLLSFLTTAGFFYINLMPAMVDGLVEGLGMSNKEAGLVSSANIYGTAFGALAIVFLINKVAWKPISAGLLIALVMADFLSIQLSTADSLMAVRFIHGLISGTLVGVGFAIIARTTEPDRTFGVLLLVQFGLGGLGVMLLPPLVPDYGTAALFLSLITFAVISLFMLVFLPDYPVQETKKNTTTQGNHTSKTKLLVLTLVTIFLFQAANMGLYAFIIGLGKHFGLNSEFINPTLGIAAWTGILGSLLVIAFGTRYGRKLPLLFAVLLTFLGTFALHFSDSKTLFFIANVGVGVTWAFVMPYLFGMCAEFDSNGRMAALGGFASKMGLASGPLVAALVLGEDNYGLLINMALLGLAITVITAVIPASSLDKQGNSEA